ncbi:MAG: DUF302 domain-containing protein [Bacteroidales bacterium]|jgi:uncharacterized protein (DUF302 family)|nr:DUF302 domain-containing protein [Bacteroidales bacterium]
MMTYYINKTLHKNFNEAVTLVKEALKEEGFGVLSEIDVHDTLKKKLNVDFRKYKILGACNPPYAHKALLSEPNVGTMLPCNVVVQETEKNQIEVTAINPVDSMKAIENNELKEIAGEIKNKLKKVIDSL